MPEFDGSNPTIRWAHLSDLHMTSKGVVKFNINTVLPSLIEDIAKFNPHFLIFSGDLSYSGQIDEYKEVENKFLVPLLKRCKNLTRKRILIAPGNHDFDWSILREIPIDHANAIKSQDDLTDFFQNKSKFHHVYSANLSFAFLAKKYGNNSFENKFPACSVNNIKIKNKKLSVSLLNSSFLTKVNDTKEINREIDLGNLAIGEYQLQKAHSASLKFKPEVSVAVCHHPTNYLAQWDKQNTENLLHKFYDFHFSGHLHSPNFQCNTNPLGNLISIQTGAVFSDYHDDNIYTRVTWFLNSNKINIIGRKYSKSKLKWSSNNDSFDASINKENRSNISLKKISFDLRDYTIRKSTRFQNSLDKHGIDYDEVLHLIDESFKGHTNYFRREFEDLPISLENKYYILVSKFKNILDLHNIRPISSGDFSKILDWNKIIFNYRKCTYFAYREPDFDNLISKNDFDNICKAHHDVALSIIDFFKKHRNVDLEKDTDCDVEILKKTNFRIMASRQELEEAKYYFTNRRKLGSKNSNSQTILLLESSLMHLHKIVMSVFPGSED